MVASCYRRMENKERALKLYEDIHSSYPENAECKKKEELINIINY